MTLKNKIDFAVVIGVDHANPNGDPLNGNRPRQTADRLGEISDVCIRRKMRNRLLAMGEEIFVQSDDNRVDECRSLKARYDAEHFSQDADIRELTSRKWFDVRAFGQVFAFSGGDEAGVSIGIRGPVTIQSAYSLEPIVPESIQITKSVNLETNKKDPDRKDGDTMGMKHRVASAVYVAYGAITPQLASKTGFSDGDAEKIKLALRSLFEGDASAARPEGSMEVLHVIWCKHSSTCGQYSSAHVHRAIKDAIGKDDKVAKEVTKETIEQALKDYLKGLKIDVLGPLEGDELAALPRREK